MPSVTTSSGVTLAFETFGAPSDPAVLLIAGLGSQLLSWDAGFCRQLAGGGRRVIRFDNRDCGLSSQFDASTVDMAALIAAAMAGEAATVRRLAPYTLHDMADDAVGLLDALAIDHAHVVGASMGGMIAQSMAIRFPHRTATLTSMMSSSGEVDVGESTPEAFAALTAPAPADRASYIAHAVDSSRIWSSRRHFDERSAAALAAAAYDRSYAPGGVGRQLAALLATGSLAEILVDVAAPTLVVHGLDDTLIAPSGGRRTAELIPDARLMLVDDMGHDRPEPLWPALIEAIRAHTAEGGPSASVAR